MTQAATTQLTETREVVTRAGAAGAFLSARRRRHDAPRRDGAVAPEPFGRRMAEIAAVVLAMPLWLPLLAGLMLWVRLDSRGPAVYRQQRCGRSGKMFTLYKLRSMEDGADEALPGHLAACGDQSAEWESGVKLRRDPRLTRAGGWLRRSSLDELPQLFNVLRGEMSLVGPRPIREVEQARYGADYADLARARPGLTGLWQVSGRNDLPYERRVALDMSYLATRTWGRDLKILIRTVGAVWTGRGAY